MAKGTLGGCNLSADNVKLLVCIIISFSWLDILCSFGEDTR